MTKAGELLALSWYLKPLNMQSRILAQHVAAGGSPEESVEKKLTTSGILALGRLGADRIAKMLLVGSSSLLLYDVETRGLRSSRQRWSSQSAKLAQRESVDMV